ncbi:MAG: radical SAM protein [Myxococcales bacterium]|nr:radical SAM protein [Myxococcales bacterium]
MALDLWGRRYEVYGNANFSVYSAQTCNARCRFCVEELRPASRGRELTPQRTVEADDGRYFAALEATLEELRPLAPTISITGGEPSKDPRLPRILATCAGYPSKRRSLTSNGSGLLDVRDGARIIDHVVAGGVQHLNISRAHPDHERNAGLMVFKEGLSLAQLREVVATARAGGCRTRLSCVLVDGAVDSLAGIRAYLDFAEDLGVDNVIFRQLMHVDRESVLENFVVRFSEAKRTRLEPLLDAISDDPEFAFVRQIVGYYYYVEVWRRRGIDVVFEEADLAVLERTKQSMPGVVHELIFHPNARLASTWQPWDGVLGPPESP